MPGIGSRLLVLAATALSLSACGGGLFGEASAPSPTVYDDVPEAAELTEERSQELYLIVVQNLRKEGQSHAALAYLDDYDMRFPGDPRARLLRADLLVDVGAYAEAAEIYRGFVDDRRLAPGAYAGLGHVAAAGNDWRSAQTAFAEASQRQPVNAKYLNALGFAQLMNGDFKAALFSLRKANELAPGNATFRNNLVLALQLGGQEADAARLVQRIGDSEERQAAERMLAVTAAELGIVPPGTPSLAATQPAPQPQPTPQPQLQPQPAPGPTAAPVPAPSPQPQGTETPTVATAPPTAGIATAESVKARAYAGALGLGAAPIVVGSSGVETQ